MPHILPGLTLVRSPEQASQEQYLHYHHSPGQGRTCTLRSKLPHLIQFECVPSPEPAEWLAQLTAGRQGS